MREILTKIWNKKFFIVFVALMVFLLPQALSRPAQMSMKAVLTEITISKANDEYTIDAKMVTVNIDEPKEVSGSGRTLAHAINDLSNVTQRNVSFAHCTQIIIGEGMEDENICDLLRYFVYRAEMNNNCALAWKEAGRKTTIEKFFKDYNQASSTGHLTYGPNKTAIFTEGKFKMELNEEQTDALRFILGDRIRKRLSHENEIVNIIGNRRNIRIENLDGNPRAVISVRVDALWESNPYSNRESIRRLEQYLEKEIKKNIQSCLGKLYPGTDILNLVERGVTLNDLSFMIKVDVNITK